MSLRPKLVGNAAIYLGANILNAGIPFLLLPILTRVLSPADYGTVAMFGVVLSVMGAFTGLSVHGAVGVRFFTLSKEELAQYVGACVGILAVSTLVLVVLVVLFAPRLAAFTGVPADWLVTAVILSGFQFLGNIRLSLWQVSGQARQYGLFQVSQSLLNAGLSLIFILLLGMAWQGRIFGQAFAVVLFGVLALHWLRRDGLLKASEKWRELGADALRFGVPLIPHVIGSLLIATSGQFFVTNMLGVSQTGIYVVAAQIGAVVGLIADAFGKSYNPWLYTRLQDDTRANQHLIVGVTYCAFIFFFVISAIASCAMYFLLPLIVGVKFVAARELGVYFIFANGFTGMYLAIAGFFFFSSKTKFVSIISILSGAVSIATMWILGKFYGITGIACGFLLAQVLMFTLAWILANMVRPMPWLQFRSAVRAVLTRG